MQRAEDAERPDIQAYLLKSRVDRLSVPLSSKEYKIAKTYITDTEARISNLKKRLEQEQRTLHDLRVAVAPHQWLPPDVLREIFLLTPSESPHVYPVRVKNSPWVLRAVCSSWRRIALAEPRFWNNFRMTSTLHSMKRTKLQFLNGHIFHPVGPLFLDIDWTNYNAASASGHLSKEILEEIIFPNLARLHSLTLGHLLCYAGIDEALPSDVPIPNLKRLSLDIYDFPGRMRRNIFTAMPKLHHLRIRCKMTDSLEAMLSLDMHWGQLTHLDLTSGYTGSFSDRIMDPLSTFELLRQCKNLTYCALTVTPREWGHHIQIDHTISLPHLTALHLDDPGLERALKSNFNTLLDGLFLPSLTHLDLHKAELSCDMLIRFVARSGCSLTSLSLKTTYAKGVNDPVEPAWEELLERSPTLRELDTPRITYPLSTFERIARGELIPHLTNLSMGSGVGEAYFDAFLDILHTRCAHASPETRIPPLATLESASLEPIIKYSSSSGMPELHVYRQRLAPFGPNFTIPKGI